MTNAHTVVLAASRHLKPQHITNAFNISTSLMSSSLDLGLISTFRTIWLYSVPLNKSANAVSTSSVHGTLPGVPSAILPQKNWKKLPTADIILSESSFKSRLKTFHFNARFYPAWLSALRLWKLCTWRCTNSIIIVIIYYNRSVMQLQHSDNSNADWKRRCSVWPTNVIRLHSTHDLSRLLEQRSTNVRTEQNRGNKQLNVHSSLFAVKCCSLWMKHHRHGCHYHHCHQMFLFEIDQTVKLQAECWYPAVLSLALSCNRSCSRTAIIIQ